MQANPSLCLSPSLNSDGDQTQFAEIAGKLSEEFSAKTKLVLSDDGKAERSDQGIEGSQREAEDEDEDLEDNDDDFSFVFDGANGSPVSADDAFHNGQIRPIFPLFNRDLISTDESSSTAWPIRPPVNKVFIQAHDPLPPLPSSSAPETNEIEGIAAGPYCNWSKKDEEASPESCKKSNSTGFSKLWRFRDFLGRSNSDGRDSFVFLNNTTATREVNVEKRKASSEKSSTGAVKVKVAGAKSKTKKVVKSETSSLTPHEIYMKNRTSEAEDERRRSYLPYRPELVGFFTNVHGGLSKNVHPF